MTDEEKLAERYVNGIPIFAEEGEGFSRTQMQRAFLAGLKAGKDEWHKLDWEKDYPEAEEWLCNNLHSASEEDFIKAMVDIAEPREKRIAELEKENAELKRLKRECETSLCRAEYQYNYEQLTKAKELLKQWLQTSKAGGCDNINIVADTEQFLQEE